MRVRALLIGLLVVVAPTLAACEPSPTAIQAAFQPNAIDVGRSAEIRGIVAPATAGTTVVLEQRVGSGWRRHRSTQTTAGGALYFHLNKPAVGTYAFRVRGGSTSSPTFYLKVHDRVPLDRRWGPTRLSTVPGSQTLADTTYQNPISYAGCAGIGSALFQFQPKGEFRVVEMFIGMAMSSPSGSQREFTIRGDGKVLRTGTANVGSHHRTRLDMTGVRQLDIEIVSKPFGCGTPQSQGTFVLGDPYLYR
jgi:hypothetical protein